MQKFSNANSQNLLGPRWSGTRRGVRSRQRANDKHFAAVTKRPLDFGKRPAQGISPFHFFQGKIPSMLRMIFDFRYRSPSSRPGVIARKRNAVCEGSEQDK